MKKLSIITINLNNGSGLKKTIRSIISNIQYNIEYIIIDGGSADNSKEIIIENVKYIDYWCSKKDSGVYNAMNKGIKQAKGEYLLFLNSGDYLINNSIISLLKNYELTADIVSCNLKIINGKYNKIKKVPRKITASYLVNNYLPHPTTLIKRELFGKVGLYNENNKIISDWEFFLKAFLIHKFTYQHIPIVLSTFVTDGMSANTKYSKLIEDEKIKILKENIPYIYKDLFKLNEFEKSLKIYNQSLEAKLINLQKKIGIIKFIRYLLKIKNLILKKL